MEPDEILKLQTDAAKNQLELTHLSLEKHLDECERIHARQTSEMLTDAARLLAADPTN